MLLGSNLNMKTKREHRNTNANVAQRRLIECRFAKRTPISPSKTIQTNENHHLTP